MPSNPRSTAKLAGHPVHPMLVPFPIVCFLLAFVLDILYAGGDTGVGKAATWLLGIGLAFAALAAIAGLIDYLGDPRVRALGDALKHMLANVAVVVIELINLIMRIGDEDSIRSTGVYLSLVAVLILLYSGWKGGELVYRHGVGVLDRDNVH